MHAPSPHELAARQGDEVPAEVESGLDILVELLTSLWVEEEFLMAREVAGVLLTPSISRTEDAA